MTREDEIRVIAYSIWEQEGCRDGYDCEHWLKAEVIWEEQQGKNRATARGSEAGTAPRKVKAKDRMKAGRKP
jgi:hypothetical protein